MLNPSNFLVLGFLTATCIQTFFVRWHVIMLQWRTCSLLFENHQEVRITIVLYHILRVGLISSESRNRQSNSAGIFSIKIRSLYCLIIFMIDPFNASLRVRQQQGPFVWPNLWAHHCTWFTSWARMPLTKFPELVILVKHVCLVSSLQLQSSFLFWLRIQFSVQQLTTAVWPDALSKFFTGQTLQVSVTFSCFLEFVSALTEIVYSEMDIFYDNS